jgi:hypothetical protein
MDRGKTVFIIIPLLPGGGGGIIINTVRYMCFDKKK